VRATAAAGTLRRRNAGRLVTGRALEADRVTRLRVTPATDLVRRVDALARRVVCQEQRIRYPPLLDGVGQEVHRGDGERLRGRSRRARVGDDSVEGVLKLLQYANLVLAWVYENSAVLGARDVPLEPLEYQRVVHLVAGGDDVRVHLVDTDLRVRDAAVVGDDHP